MSEPLEPGGAATPPQPSAASGSDLPGGDHPRVAAVNLTDLPAGTRVTYRVAQRFRYTYDGEATDLVHRLVVVPPNRHGDQTVRDSRLAVSSDAARTTWRRGADGTRSALVRLDQVPPRLDFDVTVSIDRIAGGGRPWLRATALAGRRLLDATPLTAPDPALTAAARALATDDPVATARRFCGWVHSRIRYVPGSTEVTTTAAQALAGGAGVCQDQAHVMLALCRAAGLPARYVSGHLVGDGPSHAWVEVVMSGGVADGVDRTGTRGAAAAGVAGWEPGAVAVAYDPCHDRLADLRYVTVAVGRDYSDVAPTSGWYTGAGRGTLTASQQVTVVDVQSVP
ncbi:transglutaminase family protein [Frankia sp. AiPs1]|uniref:transglutaminase family protein n=1 Tax=Frankia sp. AiPs1 TaxID=573493 RepID=UPI002042E0B1|nr:transglutaminase family protein [Frankia sp. AiPs1]MCM3920901.1 transglutaminase family protein [Frankia sp. AiPs1]